MAFGIDDWVLLGGLGTNFFGNLLNQGAQKEMTQEQLAEQRRQFEANYRLAAAKMQEDLRRSQANRALLSSLLPQVRNFQASAPSGPLNPLSTNMGGFSPQMSGGLLNIVPPGGLPTDVIDRLNPTMDANYNVGINPLAPYGTAVPRDRSGGAVPRTPEERRTGSGLTPEPVPFDEATRVREANRRRNAALVAAADPRRRNGGRVA